MRKISILMIVIACVMCACGKRSPEEQAQIYLTEARVMLQARQYAAARDTIMALRKHFPTAFQTRRQAMLVLDSIEFIAAEDSLAACQDSVLAEELKMRAEFYRRKLIEDEKKLEKLDKPADGGGK